MSASSVYTLDEEEDEYDNCDGYGVDVDIYVEDVDDDDDDVDDDEDDEDPLYKGGNSEVSAESVYTQIKQAHDIIQGLRLYKCVIK